MAGDISKKLRDLRRGNISKKSVALGNGDDQVMISVVLLSADIMLDINEQVEERYSNELDENGNSIPNHKVNKTTRNQYYNMLLCLHCVRDIDDTSECVFRDADEVGQILTLEDIRRICEAYNELVVNDAPKLEMMKQEDYDELKKYLEVTQLKDISTVSLVHLTYFLQTIRSEN